MAKKKLVSKKPASKKETSKRVENFEEGNMPLAEALEFFKEVPVPELDSGQQCITTHLNSEEGWVLIGIKSPPGQIHRREMIQSLLKEIVYLGDKE